MCFSFVGGFSIVRPLCVFQCFGKVFERASGKRGVALFFVTNVRLNDGQNAEVCTHWLEIFRGVVRGRLSQSEPIMVVMGKMSGALPSKRRTALRSATSRTTPIPYNPPRRSSAPAKNSSGRVRMEKSAFKSFGESRNVLRCITP